MQDDFGKIIDESILDINNYYKDKYENNSLGYYGQRTGFLYAGFDDFTMIYPKFRTEQTCWISHKEIKRSGTFYASIFDLDKLELPWRDRGMYGVYIGGGLSPCYSQKQNSG